MLADPVRLLAGRLRVGCLQLCGVRGEFIGVCAHRRCGVAVGEVGDKTVGVALVGHVDEGLPLDLFQRSARISERRSFSSRAQSFPSSIPRNFATEASESLSRRGPAGTDGSTSSARPLPSSSKSVQPERQPLVQCAILTYLPREPPPEDGAASRMPPTGNREDRWDARLAGGSVSG